MPPTLTPGAATDRVVADLDELEWIARRLDAVGGQLTDASRQLSALGSRLPPGLQPLYEDASWPIRRGLDAEAEAVTRLAAEVRTTAYALRLAEAGGFDPRLALGDLEQLAARPLDRRRKGTPPPPSQPLPLEQPDPLAWLRARAGWRIAAAPGGLWRLQLAQLGTAVPRDRGLADGGTGWKAGAGLVAAIAAAAYLASRSTGAGGSRSEPGASSNSTSPDPCDVGPPSEKVESARSKVLEEPGHVDAVRRELRGEAVKLKPDGAAFDHVKEYSDSQRSVKNQILTFKRIISNSNCTTDERAAAARELSTASKVLDRSERDVLDTPVD